ncbi:purine nucleoside phosphorylase-like, partial [Limulus polyphemus]|uniref:Purine nucleoside phosphorylase n=1 Tax=Limulus polyphemus TaxID=6850 RepID=A0ABM1BL79_LIMPO
YSYESIESIIKFILSRTSQRPEIGIICGTGMGGLADILYEKESFPYKEIPDFPVSTVPGHLGFLVFGKLNGTQVICMQGRFHVYEGYSVWKCVMPIRVMKLIGVRVLIITNAAGSVNQNFSVGDIMLIKDHINFSGLGSNNPLRGKNDDRWGPRFSPMSDAYDLRLRQLVRTIAKKLDLDKYLKEGVYCMIGGPSYETVSEIQLLKLLGADAVGMSTAHEVIAARHCAIRVIGISLITNSCVMKHDSEEMPANHEEVMEVGNLHKKDLEKLVTEIIMNIDTV